ncbi:MAG TPA: amidohydrolase family protein, partial [Planctomycetota bacterium]|nr:amidohydrolase family protein [Planctomycetota bacterium]
MTRPRRPLLAPRLALCGLLLGAAPRAQDVAVRGELVHTLAGPPIRDGLVLVQGGKIAAVGPAAELALPPGIEVLSAAVVTPGLIDAHSVVGLAGYLNQPTDQDVLDQGAPVQPELRAVDAYNARERLIEWVRGFGVTTLHTGHAPGALISGQTLIAKTSGDTVDEAVIVPCAMIAATLGESAQASEPGESPGTRSKLVALLREQLLAAQEYRRKRADADESKRPDRDLRLEALVELLERRVPLLVTAQRHQDISSALRVAREFELRLVLDGGAEAYQLVDEIKAAGVPVIVHPPMARAAGELENATMELAARLHAAGIPIALQSGYEDYVPKTRVVLYEAAVAAAHGLGPEAALSALTLDAARLLGLEQRLGSLEPGKDGDLALYDGDPFEYTTHCTGVVIDGRVVSREAR